MPTTVTIKSSAFDRARELILDQEFISFDDKDKIGLLPTKINKQDIVAYRFGVKWIKGYSFIIGRIYCIDIKSSSGKLIKLRLKSVYGINRQMIANKYAMIMDVLWETYFKDMISGLLDRFNAGLDIEILGIVFGQEGIVMDQKSKLIPWEDVGTKGFRSYYSVYSKSTPTIYKAFEYVNDWNTEVLYSISRAILKSKGLFSEA